MTVLVDADACPVKRIIVEEARRRGVPVTMLTDTSHVLREDYAAVVTVEKGRDSVDFKLVTLCGAGDVVVTQDYGVAAMALGRGARCLNQNGLLYTNGNIEQLLYTRHENGKARRRGHYTPVPKRTPADDEAFRRALSAMLDEGKKNEGKHTSTNRRPGRWRCCTVCPNPRKRAGACARRWRNRAFHPRRSRRSSCSSRWALWRA